MIKYFAALLFIVSLPTQLFSFPADKLRDEIDPRLVLPIKWKSKIGLSTYRSTITFQNEKIILGSNGSSSSKRKDRLDGLYIVDPITGKIEEHIVENTSGDQDVNGVAATEERLYWGNDNSMFYAFDWGGNLQWSIGVGGDVEGAPALEDFNADGVLDVCFTTEAGEVYVVDGKEGFVMWRIQVDYKPKWTYPSSRAFMASPTLVDINRDGIRDVVVGSRNGSVYALNGKTGEAIWTFRTQAPSGVFSSVFAKDGKLYATESYSRAYRLNGKGEVEKTYELSREGQGALFSSPVVTPKDTLVIGSAGDRQHRGVWIQTKTKREFHSIGPVSATPIIADIDGNGELDIVVLTENGWLYVYNEDGELKHRFSLPNGGEATPFIDDVDFDGKLELLLLTNDQFLSCYALPSSGDVYWSGFRGNPYNTGVANDVILTDLIEKNKDRKTKLRKGKGYSDDSTHLINTLITPTSIGPAQIGMTFGRLKAILGKGVTFREIDLKVGMNAKAMFVDNELQFYILYPTFKTLKDTDIMTVLTTDNPAYKTKEGIGPYTKISDAETILGPAVLTYHSAKSFEELIHFEGNDQSLWFARYKQDKAGIYKKKTDFCVTREYHSDALIEFVGIKR
jgi:outer membrane protein assembly factor BamB